MSEEKNQCEVARKRRFWSAHVRGWEGSGVSQREYCRREGVSVKTFGYWKRKLRRAISPGLGFVPVAIKPAPSWVGKSEASLRLVIGNDYGIEVGDGFKPETLRRLLDTLGERV